MGGVQVASGNDNLELDKYKALLARAEAELKCAKAREEVLQQELKNVNRDVWWYQQRISRFGGKMQGSVAVDITGKKIRQASRRRVPFERR